jgi:predicted nucleic acid-binding protein
VDASVWVSRFLGHDAHHAASVQWFRLIRAERAEMFEPNLLLPEFAGAIARHTGRATDATESLERFRAIPNVSVHEIDRGLATLAADLAAQLRLRGADALYAALASTLGIRLVTWDRELRDRARSVIEVSTPAELLGGRR